MILADRLLAFLHDRVGFDVTRWSIVRIAAFAVAALVVAGIVVEPRPGQRDDQALATRQVRNVSLAFGDPRGFDPTPKGKNFKVAWIGGSETQAVGPKTRAFIPGLVSERMGRVDGKVVSTDLYYLDAIRLVDEVSALSSALASKPDLVVISLNPVWVLNDLAPQQWDYLDGALARGSLWPPSRWVLAASFLSPGDVGWRVLSAASPPLVGDRFEWGLDLTEQTSTLSFLDVVQTPKSRATGLAALAERRPVDFWASRFASSRPTKDLASIQLNTIEREVVSRSSLNTAALQQMFEMVRTAGVPTYFYVHGINPTVYAQPDARGYVDQLRAQLAAATAGQTTSRVRFDPQGLQDRVPPTKYRDIVHVYDGRNEAAVLSTDLCALLRSTGRQADCEAP
ncbi:hypothetical protein AB4Z14_01135 [Terrabacter sp. 2TAF16]|uniref:hypothetical protein n=1 Tax=unclassified Terrabacter TaxID=2630222 RepID=UPI003F95F915